MHFPPPPEGCVVVGVPLVCVGVGTREGSQLLSSSLQVVGVLCVEGGVVGIPVGACLCVLDGA